MHSVLGKTHLNLSDATRGTPEVFLPSVRRLINHKENGGAPWDGGPLAV